MDKSIITTMRSCALRLLAKREHSKFELTAKIQEKLHKQYANLDEQDICQEINEILEEFEQKNWQSDTRFCQAIERYYNSMGKGNVRIQYTLKSHQIATHIIEDALINTASQQLELASKIAKTKLKATDYKSIAKCKRFLMQRGFSFDVINQVFKQE